MTADQLNAMQRRMALPGSQWYNEASENSPTFKGFTEKWQLAIDAGLGAAAIVARNVVRNKLARGYTTGKYARGRAARAVRVGRPWTGKQKGDRIVRVYARDFKQRFWEYGAFINGKFQRVTHWEDTTKEAGEAMARAFHQGFRARLSR
jgi:hypothetical protein